ncbi:hypothetical protein XENOCAPTIV_018566 [Xenoophorus captivus]|uniref:Uncharacterized protein n=1 Tax=Xenoophorus captivus TaxID=1517983 RepID=A0ABV0S070_9TELE
MRRRDSHINNKKIYKSVEVTSWHSGRFQRLPDVNNHPDFLMKITSCSYVHIAHCIESNMGKVGGQFLFPKHQQAGLRSSKDALVNQPEIKKKFVKTPIFVPAKFNRIDTSFGL